MFFKQGNKASDSERKNLRKTLLKRDEDNKRIGFKETDDESWKIKKQKLK